MYSAVHISLAARAKGGEGKIDTDPICLAVQAYRDGFADYNANAPEDDFGASAYAEKTYRPLRREIMEWATPARSLEGAVAALRLARDAGECDDHLVVAPMVQAALAYLENSA